MGLGGGRGSGERSDGERGKSRLKLRIIESNFQGQDEKGR